MSNNSRNATLFVPVLVLATSLLSAQAGRAATVTVNAFTTAAPFTITVSPADAAKVALGMFVQNPFAGTPSISAINATAGVITLTSQALPITTTLPAVIVFATTQSATVTVYAFTTAPPFSITVSTADAAKVGLGMFVQNPFAGTPSISAINPAGGVITLTSQALPITTPLPAVVVFTTTPSATVTVYAFTTAAPFTVTVSSADAAKVALGMFVQNPFAGTPSIIAINATAGVITLSSQALPITTTLPAVMVFAVPEYLVGDVYPFTSDSVGNFGDGALNILDLVQVLFAVNNVPGFRPNACSDRFDAMDLYPADTATTRGGDGVLDIRDLIRELFRVNNLDQARPMRISKGGCGPASPITESPAAANPTPQQGEGQAVLLLGEPESIAGSQDRVPVYLKARQNLARVAVTFALGDQQSPLRFVPAAAVPPSLAHDGQPGVVVAAWLEGMSVRAGERLLMGYVTGPAGVWANLRFYGMSASGLDDNREVILNAATTSGR